MQGDFSVRVAIPRSFAIVCIDPLVILVLEKRTAAFVRADPGDYRGEESSDDPYFCLPYGFCYGTRFAWADVIEWFSPTMEIKPSPLAFENDVGRIEVSWGALLIRREGDELVVDAVGNTATP